MTAVEWLRRIGPTAVRLAAEGRAEDARLLHDAHVTAWLDETPCCHCGELKPIVTSEIRKPLCAKCRDLLDARYQGPTSGDREWARRHFGLAGEWGE